MIPRNVRLSEAPSHGVPVMIYDGRCAGAQAYLDLAGEILRRTGRTAGGGVGALAASLGA